MRLVTTTAPSETHLVAQQAQHAAAQLIGGITAAEQRNRIRHEAIGNAITQHIADRYVPVFAR
jgi:hypothetical protein